MGGHCIFFRMSFLSALLTLDKDDIGLTFSFFKSAMSMAMIYYMVMRFGSAQGCYWGICGASLIVFLYAFFNLFRIPMHELIAFTEIPIALLLCYFRLFHACIILQEIPEVHFVFYLWGNAQQLFFSWS